MVCMYVCMWFAVLFWVEMEVNTKRSRSSIASLNKNILLNAQHEAGFKKMVTKKFNTGSKYYIFVLSKVEAYEVYNLAQGKSYDLESLQRIYFSINY